jgi:hypothetical protein
MIEEKMKHTKGEWTHTNVGNFSGTLVSYIGSSDKAVAQLRGCKTGEEQEADANAKLISAAPDLLKALIDMLPHYNKCVPLPNGTEEYKAAIKAISKAVD